LTEERGILRDRRGGEVKGRKRTETPLLVSRASNPVDNLEGMKRTCWVGGEIQKSDDRKRVILKRGENY